MWRLYDPSCRPGARDTNSGQDPLSIIFHVLKGYDQHQAMICDTSFFARYEVQLPDLSFARVFRSLFKTSIEQLGVDESCPLIDK